MSIAGILKKHWGYDAFRPLQETIIQSVLEGIDTLALLPTGGGKSICFQVPALAKEGLCIVVSPLIALMKDQVENLKKRNIRAVAVTSAMHRNEMDVALDNCAYGSYKFLYVSPERLATDLFRERLKKMNVSLLAVDEAHCISQWGYDFRPSYLRIAELREMLPRVPVLALTATATPVVAKDIQKKLLFSKANLLKKSFERKNLAYVVQKEEDKQARLLKICAKVSGTGIVYVRHRKKTEETAKFLKRHLVAADFYHAGLGAKERDEKQTAWIKNKTRVIVCTNAFGMGIDKPDVRFVVHLDLPDCIEAYFQEAGRAGRDEKRSYAVLLYSETDKLNLQHNLEQGFPPADEIKKIYQALGNHFQLAIGAGENAVFDFDIQDFSRAYKLHAGTVFHALKFLEKEGYLVLGDSWFQPSRIKFIIGKQGLYNFQVASPKFDAFIKLLLRSYGGEAFGDFVRIDEAEIARRAGCKEAEAVEMLKQLDRSGVIAYAPQSETPRITFTLPRADTRNLKLSKENYSTLKARAQERMAEITRYASSARTCRSRMLLAYFGETDVKDCGVCDVCIEKRKKELSSEEFQAISGELKHLLGKKRFPLQELVGSVKTARETKTLLVIQWMIDNDELRYDEANKLQLKK